jgi:hypothetical protein
VKLQKISCAALLPLAELSLWCALVLLPTLFVYGQLYLFQARGNASIGSGQFEFSLATVCERRFYTIVNLNLPGVLVGAPLSVPAASYLRSHPRVFSMRTWHTVTMPFFCIPAWWFLGLGMDAALTRKRLHWGLHAIGSILCCVCIAVLIGILTSPPADKTDLLQFMSGAIFWAVAFSLFPLNWLLQRFRTTVGGEGSRSDASVINS